MQKLIFYLNDSRDAILQSIGFLQIHLETQYNPKENINIWYRKIKTLFLKHI